MSLQSQQSQENNQSIISNSPSHTNENISQLNSTFDDSLQYQVKNQFEGQIKIYEMYCRLFQANFLLKGQMKFLDFEKDQLQKQLKNDQQHLAQNIKLIKKAEQIINQNNKLSIPLNTNEKIKMKQIKSEDRNFIKRKMLRKKLLKQQEQSKQ